MHRGLYGLKPLWECPGMAPFFSHSVQTLSKCSSAVVVTAWGEEGMSSAGRHLAGTCFKSPFGTQPWEEIQLLKMLKEFAFPLPRTAPQAKTPRHGELRDVLKAAPSSPPRPRRSSSAVVLQPVGAGSASCGVASSSSPFHLTEEKASPSREAARVGPVCPPPETGEPRGG